MRSSAPCRFDMKGNRGAAGYDGAVIDSCAGSSEATPPADDAALGITVYKHLRAIAQNQMNAERSGHTLSATALVHEAFLRIEGERARGHAAPPERGRFLHAAAEAMRRILIEHARARGRAKRGGGSARLSLDAIGDIADLAMAEHAEETIAFDEAFHRLEAYDGRLAQVVRLRFFAGLSVAETAEALGVSERTINNDWTHARAWLAREASRSGE